MSELITLPKGWIRTTVEEICTISAGIGFPKKYQGEAKEKIPFFKVGDISKTVQKGNIVLKKSDNYISEKVCKILKGKLFPSGATVFAKIGEALKLNRRVMTSEYSLFDNNVMVLIPKKEIIEEKYLFYFFNTVKLEKLSRSTTVPSIRKSDIETIIFLLPSLNEQKRIVSKIEELFSELNNIKDTLQKVKLQLVQYRQSLLKSAFEGKLTEEWRERNQGKIEPINENFAKKNAIKTKNTPQGWITIKIQDVTNNPKQDIVDGPFGSNLKSTEYVEKGIPLIRIQNISRNYFIDKNFKFITKEKEEQLKRHNFIANDIVITKLGFPVGKACIVPSFLKKGIIVADIIRIRMNEEIFLKKLLTYLINSNIVIRQFHINTKGTTRPRINLIKFRDFLIPYPPKEEQQEIVSKLEQEFSLIENTESVTNSMLKQLDTLRSSILKQAFEGKLVPQDPNDEPADKLLERIKEQKQSLTKSRDKK